MRGALDYWLWFPAFSAMTTVHCISLTTLSACYFASGCFPGTEPRSFFLDACISLLLESRLHFAFFSACLTTPSSCRKTPLIEVHLLHACLLDVYGCTNAVSVLCSALGVVGPSQKAYKRNTRASQDVRGNSNQCICSRCLIVWLLTVFGKCHFIFQMLPFGAAICIA